MDRSMVMLLSLSLFWMSKFAIAEMATFGEPLKELYRAEGLISGDFGQTGETADSFSMICDMGQAIPDTKKEGKWYLNRPIPGLQLELRARAVKKSSFGDYRPIGFVVVVKNAEVMKVFRPLGELENGIWDGDVFNGWSGTDTEIEVFSERYGRDGYAYFDLLDGMGFFYKWKGRDEPDYFLSNCRRIKKKELPVYEWTFDGEPK